MKYGPRESWKLYLNLCLHNWLSATCNLVSSLRFVYIERTIRTLSDNFEHLFFKSNNQFQILNIIIEIIPANNCGWKKKDVQTYSCLTLNKGLLLWFLVTRVDKTSFERLLSSHSKTFWQSVFFFPLTANDYIT